MPQYRSATSTHGRNMAGARTLWRTTGVKDSDSGKPIITIANSFTQFIPGHMDLRDVGHLVTTEIEATGDLAREFNTIAANDGITMSHDDMLYSLPSCGLITDSVKYMVGAHCADAFVCTSNCDKITPGMFMTALRLNIPTIFISSGPMKSGKMTAANGTTRKFDFVGAMTDAASPTTTDETTSAIERLACPTYDSCSGMFTANSINCLTEAFGLTLSMNGTLLATHADHGGLFKHVGHQIVEITRAYYEHDDASVLPHSTATKTAFGNVMSLDIAMSGSTNAILHLLATTRKVEVDFTMIDTGRLSRKVPHLAEIALSTNLYHVEDVHRADGIIGILSELGRGGLLETTTPNILGTILGDGLATYDIARPGPDGVPGPQISEEIRTGYLVTPTGVRTAEMFPQASRWESLDIDRATGCIRGIEHAYSADGDLAVLLGNTAEKGCIVKTAGVDESILTFYEPTAVFESRENAVVGILGKQVKSGDAVIVSHGGPCGSPGMREMLYPTTYIKSMHLDKECALFTDGRFSGDTLGLSIGHISPEAAAGGLIGLVRSGDIINIDIPYHTTLIRLSDGGIKHRRAEEEVRGEAAWTLHVDRPYRVSAALRTYAMFATDTGLGAVHDLERLEIE